MKKISDIEAWPVDIYDVPYWTVQMPVQNPRDIWLFDYINCQGASGIKEVMKLAILHLNTMEANHKVTFGIRIVDKTAGAVDVFDLRNEHDMLTMVLKYS